MIINAMDVYTVYRTTNQVNNKFYIGVHKCLCNSCQYLGSGKALKAAVSKYGRDVFTKEVLFRFSTSKEAYQKERELVNPDLVTNKLCYNLTRGGQGNVRPKANAVPVVWEGVKYESKSQCAKALGVSQKTLSRWLLNGCTKKTFSFQGVSYNSIKELEADTGLNYQALQRMINDINKKTRSALSYSVKGKVFNTHKAAADYHGISRRRVGYLIDDPKVQDCFEITRLPETA